MLARLMGLLVVMGLFLGLAAEVQAQRVKLSDNAKTAVQGNNVFAYDLYGQLGRKDGNLFFSPYSISTAFGMTYAGARNKTAEQIATTLHFSLDQNRLHPAFGELVRHLNAKGKKRPYQLSVANALWAQQGFNFLPQFIQNARQNYDAGLKELDFMRATEQARHTINQWVEDKTNEKIKNLIPKGGVNQDTRMVLTNAIYFKSAWQNKFHKNGTKEEDFTLASGTKVKVPMMRKQEKIRYYDGGSFHAVSIPYQLGGLSMVVLLPKKAAGLAELEKSMTEQNVQKWLKKMKTHQVNLKLPKFKITDKFNLNKTLAEMGMPIAFSKAADFSGMSTQAKLFIQQVIHKAFVDVHEEGTEAAAATAISVGVTSVGPVLPRATFHADHPFAFVIQENQTGSVLFMGRVADPSVK